MPNPNHHTLPIELYSSIAEHAESGDLARMMLVSRTLHDEVERVLYREVDLQVDLASHQPVFQNLSTNARRAGHVIKLRLTCEDESVEAEDIRDMIATALRQVINLQHLTLKFQGECPKLESLTERCYFQLRRFEYETCNYNDGNYIPTFFALQPQIEHLKFKFYDSPTALPPTVLPRLRTVDGPLSLTRAVLETRSRPISRLMWRGQVEELRERGPFMDLKVLNFGSKIKLETFGSLDSDLAPNLQFVELPLHVNLVSCPVPALGALMRVYF